MVLSKTSEEKDMNCKYKIHFVGTGGGGSMVATQRLSTAGTYLEIADKKFYIDPGPSAVYKARQNNIKLEHLDAILITHRHLDHISDLLPMIEAWINLTDKKNTGKKWLFIPKDYFDEHKFADFTLAKIRKLVKVEPNTVYQIGDVSIETTTRLIEKPIYKKNMPEVYGYRFSRGIIDIGFLPQAQYDTKLVENFKPKLLVLDFWSIKSGPLGNQIRLIKKIKPEKLIIRHFTYPMFQFGLDKISQIVQKQTSIPTFIAKEGEKIYE